MNIKNWKLYLESQINSDDFEDVKDAFTNLSDEYEVIITDKGRGFYNIYLNVGFDLNILDHSGVASSDFEFEDMKSFITYKDKIKKLNNLNLLIEEALSRFEKIKSKITFGIVSGFDWDILDSDDLNQITEDFCSESDQFVWISINIGEKKVVTGEMFSVDKDRNVFFNTDELKKLISKNGLTLDGEIHTSSDLKDGSFLLPNNSISFKIKESPYDVDKRYLTDILKPDAKSLIDDLHKLSDEYSSRLKSSSWCKNEEEGGRFVIQLRPGYKSVNLE